MKDEYFTYSLKYSITTVKSEIKSCKNEFIHTWGLSIKNIICISLYYAKTFFT